MVNKIKKLKKNKTPSIMDKEESIFPKWEQLLEKIDKDVELIKNTGGFFIVGFMIYICWLFVLWFFKIKRRETPCHSFQCIDPLKTHGSFSGLQPYAFYWFALLLI